MDKELFIKLSNFYSDQELKDIKSLPEKELNQKFIKDGIVLGFITLNEKPSDSKELKNLFLNAFNRRQSLLIKFQEMFGDRRKELINFYKDRLEFYEKVFSFDNEENQLEEMILQIYPLLAKGEIDMTKMDIALIEKVPIIKEVYLLK